MLKKIDNLLAEIFQDLLQCINDDLENADFYTDNAIEGIRYIQELFENHEAVYEYLEFCIFEMLKA